MEPKSESQKRGRPTVLTLSAKKRKKSEHNAKWNKSRVYLGHEIARWKSLRAKLRLKTNAEMANVLLDSYETVSTDGYKQTTSTPAFTPERSEDSKPFVLERSVADSADSVGTPPTARYIQDVSIVKVEFDDQSSTESDDTDDGEVETAEVDVPESGLRRNLFIGNQSEANTVSPSLSDLPLWEIHSKLGLYVAINDIIGILRANRSPNDLTKDVKRDNIHRELKTYKEGIIEKDGCTVCPLASFYRYCFKHYDGYEFCKTVCNEIILETLPSRSNYQQFPQPPYIADKSTVTLNRTLIQSKVHEDLSKSYTPNAQSDVKFLVDENKYFPDFKDNDNLSKICNCEREDFAEPTNSRKLCQKHVSPAQYQRDPKWMAMFGDEKAYALSDIPLDLEDAYRGVISKVRAEAGKRTSNKRGLGEVQGNSTKQSDPKTRSMNSFFKVPLLDLPCFYLFAEFYVKMSTFHHFLKRRHTETDRAPVPTKNGLRSEVVTYEHGVRKVGNHFSMTITALLRYAFVHCDDFEICRMISDEVKKTLRTLTTRKIRAREPRQPLIIDKTSEERTPVNTRDDKPRCEGKQNGSQSALSRCEVLQPRYEIQHVSDSVGGKPNHCTTTLLEMGNQNHANYQFPGQPDHPGCQTDTQPESKEMDLTENLHNLQNEMDKSSPTDDIVVSTVTEEHTVSDFAKGLRPLFLQKVNNSAPVPVNAPVFTQAFKNRLDVQKDTPFTDPDDILLRQSPLINPDLTSSGEELSLSHNCNRISSCGLEPANANNRNSHVDIVPETLSIKIEHELDEDTVSCNLEPTNANNKNSHVDIMPETLSIKIEQDTVSCGLETTIAKNRNSLLDIMPETLSIKTEHEMDEDKMLCDLEPTNANNKNSHVDIVPETLSIKIEQDTVSCGLEPTIAKNSNSLVDIVPETLSIKIEHEMDEDKMLCDLEPTNVNNQNSHVDIVPETVSIKPEHEMEVDTVSCGLEPTNANNRNSHEDIRPETLSIKIKHEMDEDTVSCDIEPTNANNRNPHVDIRPETLSIKTEHELDEDTVSNKLFILESSNQKTNGKGNTLACTRQTVLDDVKLLRSSYNQGQPSCFEAMPIDPVTTNSGQFSGKDVQ